MIMFEIRMTLSQDRFEEIHAWCRKNLWHREGLVWQVGMDPRKYNEYIWCFTRQEDHTFFRLTWCYEPA